MESPHRLIRTVCLCVFFVGLVHRDVTANKFDYTSLLENLHNAVKTNFGDEQEDPQSSKAKVQENPSTINEVKVSAGRVFKESLARILGHAEDDFNLYEVEELNKKQLPSWLKFDHGRNKFVGIPTQSDVGRYTITVKSVASDGSRKTTGQFDMVVKKDEADFQCRHGGDVIVATIIFNANIQALNIKGRLKLVRSLADVMELDMRSVHISEGNGLGEYGQLPTSIISAGPGDRLTSRQPGVTLSWQIPCGLPIAGARPVAFLKGSAGTGAIHRLVGVEVVGWYLSESQSRVRRQLPQPAATPTPAVTAPTPKFVSSVFATPAISAPPSITKMTSFVKPTPVKSSVVVISKTPTTEPPVVTTTEPTTKPTTQKPTTEKPTTEKPTTEKPTTEKPTTEAPTTKRKPITPMTKPKNKEPELINSIDNLAEYVGQPHRLPIKDDMFSDEDGNARNLKLELKMVQNKTIRDVKKGSWIAFNELDRNLYILPGKENVGLHEYVIRATDSGGLATNAVFFVAIEEDSVSFNNVFNVSLDMNYDIFMANVKNRVDLLTRIAEATQVNYRTLRAQSFSRGSVVMEYSCQAIESQDDPCNSAEAAAYEARLKDDNFKLVMSPKYRVQSTASSTRLPCDAPGDDGPRAGEGGKKDSGKWWEIVMIPIIVIAALLLLIGLIFCCLYRQKRRYEPPKEDQNTYIYHKKPVIFMEEYEEKPDLVSLEPLILPNEKPPLQAPPYQPRSSTPEGTEGAASSTVSTESDEKAPLTSNQTSPRESPRKPAYSRSPPPYTGS